MNSPNGCRIRAMGPGRFRGLSGNTAGGTVWEQYTFVWNLYSGSWGTF